MAPSQGLVERYELQGDHRPLGVLDTGIERLRTASDTTLHT
ncbi:hypothetical protein [Streptomyces justiciae]|nr:hypothetical protein [Streptomyces justiciae]MCW8380801.1 hypothetical protein [Streptomyces justiciae]